MEEATKTVEGFFGPKQMTKAEFVKQWADHFAQVAYLTNSHAEALEVMAMQERIKAMAAAKWDNLK